MRDQRTVFGVSVVACLVAAVGCSTYKETTGQATRPDLEQRAKAVVKQYKEIDPSLDKFFASAAGYAVFPSVAKGGAGVGGAHGEGVLFQDGEIVGYTELTQGTLGFQLGGQSYSELIFFKTKQKLEEFKRGNLHFAGEASAVAAAAGAAAQADYSRGVAIFKRGSEGLMAEAVIGGQRFSYTPKPEEPEKPKFQF